MPTQLAARLRRLQLLSCVVVAVYSVAAAAQIALVALLVREARLIELVRGVRGAIDSAAVADAESPLAIAARFSGFGFLLGSALLFVLASRLTTLVDRGSMAPTRYGPRMAMLGWLIPVAGLVIGPTVLRDVWLASRADRDGRGGRRAATSHRVMIVGVALCAVDTLASRGAGSSMNPGVLRACAAVLGVTTLLLLLLIAYTASVSVGFRLRCVEDGLVPASPRRAVPRGVSVALGALAATVAITGVAAASGPASRVPDRVLASSRPAAIADLVVPPVPEVVRTGGVSFTMPDHPTAQREVTKAKGFTVTKRTWEAVPAAVGDLYAMDLQVSAGGEVTRPREYLTLLAKESSASLSQVHSFTYGGRPATSARLTGASGSAYVRVYLVSARQLLQLTSSGRETLEEYGAKVRFLRAR